MVYSAMQKYHDVLSERSKLIEEVVRIQEQNTEFEQLLQGYQNSDINKELCIPPAQLIN